MFSFEGSGFIGFGFRFRVSGLIELWVQCFSVSTCDI